jgi:hypothetical protein
LNAPSGEAGSDDEAHLERTGMIRQSPISLSR